MSERIGPETRAIVDAVRATEDMPENPQIGLWKFERIGRTDIYKVYLANATRNMLMTGVNIVTQLQIPFPHRWIRIHFFLYTAVGFEPFAMSVNFLRVSLRREAQTTAPATYIDELFCEFNMNDGIIQEQFGEGFEYEAGAWNLITNAPVTDGLIPVFYIQKLKTVGK